MDFQCNICSSHVRDCPPDRIDRETVSCPTCHSTVRVRSIVHLLSMALYSRTMALTEFPVDRAIVGLGLSEEHAYADMLAERFSYTNTFYHREPRFDICGPLGKRSASSDFLIATEVFEHIAPPLDVAFRNAFEVLKPGGTLIFTVPYSNEEQTVEHFPDLHEVQVVEFSDERILINRSTAGSYTLHRNLVFHGGLASTLELRLFCRRDIEERLAAAGFVNVEIFDQDVPQWGILHKHPWSLPFVAKRPGQPVRARAGWRSALFGT